MKIFNTFGQLAAAKVLTGTPVRVLEPALIDGVVEATGEGLSLLSGNVFVPSFGDQESITARKTSLLDDAFTGGISAYLNTYKKDNSGNWVESSTGRTSAVFYAGQVWWPLVEIPYTPGGYLVTGWGLPTGNPDILEVTTSIGTVFQFNRFTGLIDGGNSGGSTVSDTPPVNPLAGNRWTRCSDMKSFLWYVDNDGAQWIEDNPSMGGALSYHNDLLERNEVDAHISAAVSTVKHENLETYLEVLDTRDFKNYQNRVDSLQSMINVNKNITYQWGGRGDSILGDSISHMAFSKQAFYNNWTNIFKRCRNAETETSSYGFVSILPYLGSGSNRSYEIHDVTNVGTWTALTLGDCEWSISGYALESSTVNDELRVVVPSFQNHFGIWFHSFSGGGTFEILVNGVSKGTVDTNGTDGSTRTSGLLPIGQLDVVDNGTGVCNITIKVISGTVRIIGVSYENYNYDLQVSNFSQSGRRLRYVSREVIQKSMDGAVNFILALGFNDGADCQSDPAYLAAVQQRIDWIIEEANTRSIKVWILNFCWQRPETDNINVELKRCANNIKGASYIRFGDFLKMDGSTASSQELTDTIRLWVDSAHPTVLGHKLIAETVAKSMGLSCCSKRDALLYHDWWIPIKFNSTLRNTFDSPLQVSAFKRNGNSLMLRIYCYSNTVDNATTAIPAGTYNMIDAAQLPYNIYVPQTTFYPLDWSTNSDETIKPYFSALVEARLARNGFRLIVKTTTERNIDGLITVPIYTSERIL